MMAGYIPGQTRKSGGCGTAIEAVQRQFESTGTEDWGEAQQRLRQRLQARDENTLTVLRKGEPLKFDEWVQFFWITIPNRRCVRARRTLQPASGHALN